MKRVIAAAGLSVLVLAAAACSSSSSGSTGTSTSAPAASAAAASSAPASALGTATASASVASPPPPPLPAPTLKRVRESNKRWRDGGKLAGISRARRRRTPVGTSFSFTLNEAARVSLKFVRETVGRRVKSGHKSKCATATRRNRKDRRCTLTKAAGTLSLSAREGADKVSFDGRIKGAKKLAAGSYTVTIEATNARGAHSAAARLSFTVVK